MMQPKIEEKQKIQGMPPYNVILLDDSSHSYDYVIRMMMDIFGHPQEKGEKIAQEVDKAGSVIVKTCHLEKAEMYQEKIHKYGADPLIPNCQGPMTAVVQPA